MQTRPQTPDASDLCIGAQLRALRQERGLSLARLAELTGISDATLSRVENAQTLVSAHNLYILAQALAVDITAFYAPAAQPLRSGIRAISRGGAGHQIDTARYAATILGAELAHKKMHPAIDLVSAQDLDAIGGLAAHAGEEFLFVLSGVLILHSAHYAPLRLEAGDSIYFDASMPHAYLSGEECPARILVINSAEPTFAAASRGATEKNIERNAHDRRAQNPGL